MNLHSDFPSENAKCIIRWNLAKVAAIYSCGTDTALPQRGPTISWRTVIRNKCLSVCVEIQCPFPTDILLITLCTDIVKSNVYCTLYNTERNCSFHKFTQRRDGVLPSSNRLKFLLYTSNVRIQLLGVLLSRYLCTERPCNLKMRYPPCVKGKGKVFPLQARCGPEGG